MTVLRIVTNVATDDTGKAICFYRDLLGMETIMDLGWIATWSSGQIMTTQISVASEGGSGTPVPDMTIGTCQPLLDS